MRPIDLTPQHQTVVLHRVCVGSSIEPSEGSARLYIATAREAEKRRRVRPPR